ncbi:hypothetical protein AQUCO_02800083v1 [Aquilegia coerulea]|uniref:Disease resistance protein At4g27190-like leucine-rich repeats domain-containing protein n=1 Tax=Aquilegia coerulea TaxID=218851 RepID=A0A2G5D3T0_AQUCA|nr:hypothetical protein AQUCO_02800083v1 [Aquilegia coerulea]
MYIQTKASDIVSFDSYALHRIQTRGFDYEGTTETQDLVFYGNADNGFPHDYFAQMLHLSRLSILHYGISSLPESLSDLKHLEMLVLRGCTSLEVVNQVRELQNLIVLSLAGASSLKELPDDFFQDLGSLEYLNLSNTHLKQLPSSFSNLHKLDVLILRACGQLERISYMEEFDQLSLLDLAGAYALKDIPDTLSSLKTLDLSVTLVDRLPSAPNINHLFLRGCSRLQTMADIDAFPELQVLDLSGASAFLGFQGENSGSDSSIIKLDLSGTQIAEVSFLSRCGKLRQLFLRSCPNIETLPSLGTQLNVIDLSGAISFKKFQDVALTDDLLYLYLSRTQIEKLPVFSMEANLIQLLLKQCEYLKELPRLKLQKLEVLDLSGAISFKEFQDEALGDGLLYLDLSRTLIQKLPMFSMEAHLVQLILRECEYLEELPQLELQKLEVLDVTGSINLKNLKEDCFQKLSCLKMLNLSATQVVQLPNLSECCLLQQIFLKNCLNVQTLPPMTTLTELEVLDLSGATGFRKFQDDSLGIKECFRELNLSETQVEQLPSLSECSNLRHILLRRCIKLETLPLLKPLTKLEVLDLSGATAFKQFHDDSLGIKEDFRELDLSGTQVQEIPSLSECYNLCKLILKGCVKLKVLPHIETLASLQVLDLSGAVSVMTFKDQSLGMKYYLQTLDLSGTQVVELPILAGCINLSQLLLRDCQKLRTLPPLDELRRLKVLDLSGAASFLTFQELSFGEECDLELLDLTGTQVADLQFLSGCPNVSQLFLRNCPNLRTLPPLELGNLRVLDLSGSASFTTFQDPSFGKDFDLQILNLSGSQIGDLQFLYGCSNLSQLFLRNCPKLMALPAFDNLRRLKVLDLSGATSFMTFQDISVGMEYDLQILDISGTQVVDLPFLSGCVNLSQLALRGCIKLQTLSCIKELTKLKLLDLSGATSFTTFQDLSFGNICDLQILDLSGTQVVELSFLSDCINLNQLLIRDCLKFQTLPHLEKLERLEVLDLSGDASFSQFQDEPLGVCYALKKLDLSGTQVQEFSFLSRCKNLCQLRLKDLSNFETLSFEGILNLEELNLSGSQIGIFPSSPSELQNIRQLFLRGCSNLTILPHSEVLKKLEVVDLSGTNISEFPAGISKWTCLKFLAILNRKYFWGFNWRDAMDVTKQLQLNLSETEHLGMTCIHITVSNTDIFYFIEKNSGLWGNRFQKFHFCLCSSEQWSKENDIYLQGKGYVFKDIYYQTSHIPQLTDEPDKFLKICGFHSFPTGIEQVLNSVELLYLKKNGFINRLSDLGVDNVKSMRECWIESCDSMESAIYGEEKEKNAVLGRYLQNLWVSKLSELKSLFRGSVDSESFACLKHLYIECCPSLVIVFSSHIQLKNLATLKIKFCDELENIFGETTSREQTLPNLKTLNLLKLPKLKTIFGGVLPLLKHLRVQGCPKLQKIPVSVNSPCVKIKGELVWWKNLKWEDESTNMDSRFTEL